MPTTHTLGGAMELSVAYLRRGLFRITATALDVSLNSDAVAAVARTRPAPVLQIRRT